MKYQLKRIAVAVALIAVFTPATAKEFTLLNASYDPTRELYKDFNAAFAKYWKEKTGDSVVIRQSHGGSGAQARAVINGLEADVVTLALAYDIDMVSRYRKLVPRDWQKMLPDNSCPYTSVVVFLVRKGNPKNVKDWPDLVRPEISVITPNPKTSGGARWNYLAAYGFELKRSQGDQSKAKAFVKELFERVPVLNSGTRGATTTFAQRGIGDVLITWENEALLAIEELGNDKFEIVRPSITILAEPPVAVVDGVAGRHGTGALARAYLEYLYTPEGQEIAARHFYRPRLASVAEEFKAEFPSVAFFSVDGLFGGWQKAQKDHFSDGGTFDQIYRLKP